MYTYMYLYVIYISLVKGHGATAIRRHLGPGCVAIGALVALPSAASADTWRDSADGLQQQLRTGVQTGSGACGDDLRR